MLSVWWSFIVCASTFTPRSTGPDFGRCTARFDSSCSEVSCRKRNICKHLVRWLTGMDFKAKLLFAYHFSCLKFCLFLMWSDSNMIPFWQDVCDRILWHIFTECWGLDGKWKALRCLGSTTLHSSCKLRGYRVTSDMSMQPFATHRYTFRINKKKHRNKTQVNSL